ncbi:MAG: hypothetical protein KC933_30855 [Myxococcales bacterium]|nr:hypothetical protein [Myxococcales bacterium]
MSDATQQEKLLNRRKALHVLGATVAASSAVLMTACKGESKPAPKAEAPKPAPKPAAAACGDPATLDEQSKTLRSTLQYVPASPHADKSCKLCMQYTEESPTCGACKLFTGGVSPAGYCLSFAPKTPA